MPSYYEDSELIHAAGRTWKDHKYIAKIGNRYFYTREELAAYGKERVSSAAKSVRSAIAEKTGATAKARATVTKSAADLAFSRTQGSERALKRITSSTEDDRYMQKSAAEHVKANSERAKELRQEAEQLRNDVYDSREYKQAQLLQERVDSYEKKLKEIEGKPGSERIAANYRQIISTAKKGISDYESTYQSKLRRADNQDGMADDLEESNRTSWASIYSSYGQSAAQKAATTAKVREQYLSNLSDYQNLVKLADQYEDEYNKSFLGKVEKARDAMTDIFSQIQVAAASTISSGQEEVEKFLRSTSSKVDSIIDDAEGTVAAGLGWIQAIFEKKK